MGRLLCCPHYTTNFQTFLKYSALNDLLLLAEVVSRKQSFDWSVILNVEWGVLSIFFGNLH